MNEAKRIDLYRWLVAITIIVTVFATWSLWSSERSCPTAPLIGAYSLIAGNYGIAFRAIIIILSVLFALKVRYAEWLLAIVLTIGIADDLNRLLPNIYQFIIVLALFGLADKSKPDTLLNALRIIQAGVYLWTGILKMQMGFVNGASAFIFNALHIYPPVYVKYLVILVALWEVAIAIAFLSGKIIREALLSTVVLHAVISCILLLAHWNRAIISYNLFLLAGNYMLFSKSSYWLMGDVEQPKARIQKIAVALFIVLPLLNIAHWWPDFMSSSLYSYRGLSAVIYVDENLKKQLPEPALRAIYDSNKGPYLSLTTWIQNETGTVPCPESLVYEKMYYQFRQKYQCSDSVRMLIY